MKNLKILILTIIFMGINITFAQTARLQVIHNAADIAADPVDVYLNGTLLLNDFAFRAATPFIDAPAGTPINIGVAPGNSSSVNDTLKNFTVTLTSNETYVAIANGVLTDGYASNPNGRNTNFTLFVKPMARETATSSNVDFFVLHGATDAPTVDVIARGVATLVDNAAYGDMTDYISVPAASYTLDVTPGNENSTIVASFQADLSGLSGGSAVVFASGFLTPSANQNGEAFGIFAALANGTVVKFPTVETARLQVIHNAADIAADPVDVYLNGTLLLNDFAFRAATPFIDAPAGIELNIGVAPGNSTSVNDTLKNFQVTLENGNTYVAIANGVLDPNSYSANPNGKSTAFTLFVKDMARESAIGSGVDLFVLHGSSDAPTVDVKVRELGSATIVDDAGYGDITDYITAPAQDITLDLYLGDGKSYVTSFTAPLSGLEGAAAAVFASGFLTPSANQNGAAFGLFAALPNGTVVALPSVTEGPTARVQVIHNSADVLAGSVDVYVNDALAIPDFGFRAATPFIDLPAGVTLNIGIAPGNSTSVSDTIKNFPVVLSAGEKYVVFANGVLTDGYAANPDGRNTNFTLFVKPMARETATSSNVDFFVLHGATDAPTVDVIARGVATLVDNAAYGDITDYISVPAASYTLDVTPGNDNSTIVASFQADLSGLDGGSAVVFASGFLTPSANQNGEAFGIFAALANGTVVELPTTGAPTSVENISLVPANYSLLQNYPNPFNPSTIINFTIPNSEFVTLRVFNILGSEVATIVNENLSAGAYRYNFDAQGLASGVYLYEIKAGNFREIKKMNLLK